MTNEKFTFVNDIESDIVDHVETSEVEGSIKSEHPKQEFISDIEHSERVEVVKVAIIMIIVSVGLFVFALIWQDDTSLMGICNAFWLVVVIEFFIGWMMLMNNMNILSPLVYGATTFAKMLVGKRMDSDYYNYSKMKEENPIPRYYYRTCFICALINAIPAVILMFIV